MPLPETVETEFVELLAHVYARIPWSKMRTAKNAWDIWNHRVRAASTRATLGEFISRLCNRFGLQHLSPEATSLCLSLRPHEQELLDLAYREHVPISMRAVVRAKELKGDKDEHPATRRTDRSTQPDLPLR